MAVAMKELDGRHQFAEEAGHRKSWGIGIIGLTYSHGLTTRPVKMLDRVPGSGAVPQTREERWEQITVVPKDLKLL